MEKQILSKSFLLGKEDVQLGTSDAEVDLDRDGRFPKDGGVDEPAPPETPGTGDNADDGDFSVEKLDAIVDYLTTRSRKGCGFEVKGLWVSTESLLLALNLLVAVVGIIVIAKKK